MAQNAEFFECSEAVILMRFRHLAFADIAQDAMESIVTAGTSATPLPAVEKPDPMQIGFLRTQAIVTVTNPLPTPIQKARRPSRSSAGFHDVVITVY